MVGDARCKCPVMGAVPEHVLERRRGVAEAMDEICLVLAFQVMNGPRY